MSHEHHEHDGHCCGAEMAAQIGNLCLSGQCQHVEHRPDQDFFIEQLQAVEQLAAATVMETKESKPKKTKKKQYQRSFGQILLAKAT